MDDLERLIQRLSLKLSTLILLVTAPCMGLYIAARHAGYSDIIAIAIAGVIFFILTPLIATYMARTAMQPFAVLRQGILHVSSESSRLPAPKPEYLKLGREMVSTLVMNVYTLASHGENSASTDQVQVPAIGQDVLNAAPLPIFTITPANKIHSANTAAMEFLGQHNEPPETLIGKDINDVLNLSFTDNSTYESWLNESRKKVLKAEKSWSHVRLEDAQGHALKQFDLAASYTKAGGEIDSILLLFDHTTSYAQESQELSFVSMAVHELRTPLTVMRGYIEVFQDELGPTLNPELKDFMLKMNASAQQLTAFVGNILNVARVEENQLTLTLQKQDLKTNLQKAVEDLQLRAGVHGKQITLTIANDVPSVAIDPISIHEVINNLVDNAIKYSGKSEKILINAYVVGTMVQIDVQDFGVGIPDSVVPRLFDKFYRGHRSKGQIGGTGLGLYLCKALITAHGGNIWVKTKVDQGSIFSFTLEPYNEAVHGIAAAGSEGITRSAHGWIKNHSMYRQ